MLCAVLSCSGVSSSLGPHGLQPARLSPWGFSRQEYWSGLPSSRLSSQPRDQSQVFVLQVNSLLYEPPGKPKDTAVGSHPFSRGTSWPRNWTTVSCIGRRILYQLSYQESLNYQGILSTWTYTSSFSIKSKIVAGTLLNLLFTHINFFLFIYLKVVKIIKVQDVKLIFKGLETIRVL